MKIRKEKMLTIRVTDELMRRLDMMAKLTGEKRSHCGRSILIRHIDKAISAMMEDGHEDTRGHATNRL